MVPMTYQLKNGLQVILIESHKAPVVSVQMWVRTGSADEPKGYEGISHFIEHLVFKGSRDFKPGEIASFVEGSGGELNAYTSLDQTVFYVTMASSQVDAGLHVVSQMMGYPQFDANEVDSEREVVVEEIKRGQDSLSRRGFESLFSTHFAGHPYGRPVIGYEKNIRTWSADQIRKYFESQYNPKNMFLVVAGDFSKKEMKEKVVNWFGPMTVPKKKLTKSKKKLRWSPASKALFTTEKTNFQQGLVYLAFPVPGLKHKDIPALDVLAMVFGQGESSRLVKRLRMQNALVQSVGATAYSPHEGGLFMVSLVPRPEKFQEALGVLREEWITLTTELVDKEEMQKAIRNIEIEDEMARETVDGLSQKFGSMEFYYRDLKANEKYKKALRSLKQEDLLRVAKKYLQPKLLRTIGLFPQKEFEAATETLKEFCKSTAQSVPVRKSAQKAKGSQKIRHDRLPKLKIGKPAAAVEVVTLENGVRLFLRPSQDTAVVSARASFMGGTRLETPETLGRMEMLGRTWMGGTSQLSEEDFSQKLEQIGASIGPVIGRNSIGLSLDVATQFQKPARELFLAALTDPIWKEEVFKRELTMLLQQLKARQDQSAQLCFLAASAALFPNHPYGYDVLGTERTLNNLKTSDLKKIWSQVAQRKNLAITICGNFSVADWKKALEPALRKLPTGALLEAAFPVSDLNEDVRVQKESTKEQSHVAVVYRGLKLNDQDRDVLQVMQSILAGQGGRLFLELRDKASLAYSVSPIKMEGLDAGTFGAYIACSPSKVDKAISMMAEEFDKLVKVPVGDQELLRSQRYLAGRSAIDQQRTSNQANAIHYSAIYNLDPMDSLHFAERVFAVSAADVQRLARKIFSQRKVISIVGS